MLPTISLMDAYMIETLLSKGVEKEKLVQAVQTHTVDQFVEIDGSYDYRELNQAITGKENMYQEAVENGYAISYLTLYGLKNLLRMKFGFEETTDYTTFERKIEDLVVTPAQLDTLTKLVGKIWTIKTTAQKEDDSVEISILHVSLTEEV